MLQNHHNVRWRYIKSHNLYGPTQWKVPSSWATSKEQGALALHLLQLSPSATELWKMQASGSYRVLWGPGQCTKSKSPEFASKLGRKQHEQQKEKDTKSKWDIVRPAPYDSAQKRLPKHGPNPGSHLQSPQAIRRKLMECDTRSTCKIKAA